jgi:3-phenylpropionate/trans-cinnamate dioxygenase ferredoxin reductase component
VVGPLIEQEGDPMTEPYVIVGGGLAGGKAVETLRAEGFDGPVVLVTAEPERPYERPPLSKGYLLGKEERDAVYVHDAGWYDLHDVDLRTGARAVRLDPGAHRLELQSGESLAYGRLLLATGAHPRHLPVPGADLSGVHYLRTVANADRLREALAGGGRRVVVVGAGWIGLEVAAAARGYGNDVTVIEPQPTPLHAVLGPEMGEVFARRHRDHGVDLRTGTGLREFGGTGAVDSVLLDDGERLAADLVVVGIGVVPSTGLAADAGLEVDDGIGTDAALRTSAPDVYAAGDVAGAFHPMYGRRVRVEHWANALNQGPAAARSMLGQEVSYDRVPYFYTDQYDLGMEYSGLAGPGTTVVTRGDPDGGEFIAFWLEDGAVRAGMNVNVWDVTEPIQALIRAGRPVDVGRLTDPGVPLDEVLS